mgnify:CR=1 FL=1
MTALGKHRHGGAMLQGRRLQPVICPGSAMSQPGVRGKYGRTHDYFGWHQAYCGAPDAGFQNAGGEYEPIFT